MPPNYNQGPAPPRAAPPPATSTRTGNNPRGVAIVSPPAPARAAPSHVSQLSPSQAVNQYNPHIAQAIKASPQYQHAVVAVFKMQTPQRQALLTKQALQSPHVPENQFILNYLHSSGNVWNQHGSLGSSAGLGANVQAGHQSFDLPGAVGSLLKQDAGVVGQDVKSGVSFLSNKLGIGPNWQQSVTGQKPTPGATLLGGATKGVQGLIQAIPSRKPSGAGEQIAAIQGLGPGQFGKNVLSDAANFYGEAFPSMAITASDAITNPKKGLQDVLSLPKQIIQNPVDMMIHHPFLTAMVGTSLIHGGTRAIAGPVRALADPASAVGRALSTKREGVHLTGNLTMERPPYSLSPTIKSQQASIDRALYKRSPTGELVFHSEQKRAQALRKGIASMVSVREITRRLNREQVIHQRESAVRASLPTKAAHGVRTAAAYDPAKAAIPGANVLSRIADLTARRPGTFAADLTKHMTDVSANRPNLIGRNDLLKEHDAYIAELQKAIAHPPNAKGLQKLFAAAEKARADYAPTQEAARQLGHFGSMSQDALLRRDLMHYAVTHMDAKMEVNPATGDQALMRNGKVLPNQAILDHLNGPNGTGSRLPAFTSDRPASNSSYYVSSEKRPLPTTAKNTLFAYTHGLTRLGHDALTEQHVRLQGIVDAHRSQNELANTLAIWRKEGGGWQSHKDAAAYIQQNGLLGHQPLNMSQTFHPQASLDAALQNVHPATIEQEAARHGLDLSERLRADSPGNRWALVDMKAMKFLREQQNTISPIVPMRVLRGLNNQFRQVALGLSPRHVPGVASEQLIRDIQYGVGLRSWMTERRMFKTAEKQSPGSGQQYRARLAGGGMVAGSTELMRTHEVAAHYEGTNLYPVVKGMESFFKAPGPRQFRTAWKAWSNLVIRQTKLALEQQHMRADIGKSALREHGYAEAARTQGMMAAIQRLFGLHGQQLDEATRGIFNPARERQVRAEIAQIRGHWTDLTPTGKTALMMSPFGMWWMNSARFLARSPIDAPIKTGLLASMVAGTQQQRQQYGLDPFAPGALPLYKQGGIPIQGGKKLLAQNYYSPWGIANDPLGTGQSLIAPWAEPLAFGALGKNWLGKNLTSPKDPRGTKQASVGESALYMIESALSSFVPFYMKARQVAAGGASQYDVSPNPLPWKPATKKPSGGIGKGLATALKPYRENSATSSSSSGGGGYLLNGSSSGHSPYLLTPGG